MTADSRQVDDGGIRGLVLQYLWLAISRVVAAALQAVSVLLLARWTLPSAFGQIVAVLGVLVVVGALADMGLGPFLLRERSADRNTSVTGKILKLNSVTSCVLCLLVASGLGIIGFVRSEDYLVLLPLSLWVAAEKNGDVWLNVATADGRTHLNAISLLFRRTASLGIFVALVNVCSVPLAFALGQAAASILANALMRICLRQPADEEDRSTFRQLTLRAFPFYLNSVGAQLRNLDVAIVFWIAGPIVGGVYALPARLTSPLRMLPASLAPIIVRYSAMGTRSALGAIRIASMTVMMMMSFVLVILFVGAPEVVSAALGPSYLPSVLALRITCIGLVFAFAVSLQTSFLQGRGYERFVGRTGMAVSALALPALALGAGLYGAAGAAIAVAASFCVHSLVLAPRTAVGVRALSSGQTEILIRSG